RMTVRFNGRVSMNGVMIVAVVISLQPVFHDVPALLLCLGGGVAAALSVRGLRRRSNFYVPVLIIALGYLGAALALGLAGNWSIAEIGLRGVWGAANGLVAAGLSFFLLPLAESVTGITTVPRRPATASPPIRRTSPTPVPSRIPRKRPSRWWPTRSRPRCACSRT